MVQFLHDILLNELESYLSKRPIKRKSKQHLETVEIDKFTIEKLVENSKFYPEAKGSSILIMSVWKPLKPSFVDRIVQNALLLTLNFFQY